LPELILKVVYDGPPLSGKTTNLKQLHAHADPQARGRLMTFDDGEGRTVLFDLLPLSAHAGDTTLRLRVYSVPGQVEHKTTRRVVLAGADGVVFVADCQSSQLDANQQALADLRQSLRELDADQVPVVVQVNKRDLAEAPLDPGAIPACAKRAEGVVETFLAIVEKVLARAPGGVDPSTALTAVAEAFAKRS
jgi:mutual gliding-motility protein MglA